MTTFTSPLCLQVLTMSVCFLCMYIVHHYLTMVKLFWGNCQQDTGPLLFCQIRPLGPILLCTCQHTVWWVELSTWLLQSSKCTGFMKSLKVWMLVKWTDFKVCKQVPTSRMLFLQGYLFRVLDSTPIYLSTYHILILPYHIPDKSVGMFLSSGHLRKHQVVIWNVFTPEYLGWWHPCSC